MCQSGTDPFDYASRLTELIVDRQLTALLPEREAWLRCVGPSGWEFDGDRGAILPLVSAARRANEACGRQGGTAQEGFHGPGNRTTRLMKDERHSTAIHLRAMSRDGATTKVEPRLLPVRFTLELSNRLFKEASSNA